MPTPQEKTLDRYEAEWSPRLRGVSLAAEVEVDPIDAERAAEALGFYFRESHRDYDGTIVRRWPSCVVTVITAVAIDGYQSGSLWPAFDDTFGLVSDQDTHNFWGDAFRMSLQRAGLETFDRVTHRNIGPILMHAGVPLFCFDDLLRLLVERSRLDPDLDADTFLSWATDQPQRINVLDVPVRRFLAHGTDFALDFVGRCLDMLEILSTQDADMSTVTLPSRFTNRATDLMADSILAKRPPRTGSRSARVQRPRVSLDPWGGGVGLDLPSVGNAPGGAATWEVVQDGIATVVKSRTAWVGVAEAAPGVKVRINNPVRSLVVRLVGAPREYELQLVNGDVPWLVFDDAGRLIPTHAALPRDAAWLLYPTTYAIEADGPLRVIEEGQVPGGWTGWTLERVALDATSWVQLKGIPTSRRVVRGFSQPRIEAGQPVNGIESPYGSRVFGSLPQVILPGRDGAQTDWRITVRAASTGDIVHQRTVSLSHEATVTDLLDDLPRPVLGAYSISVGGPLGYGVERSVFVAEGLQADFIPGVRALTWDGLTAATASVTGPVGAVSEPARLTFTASETTMLIEYRTDKETEPLRVRPPHLRVSYETAGRLPSWQPRPVSLIAEDLQAENGVLAVHLPGNGAPAFARLIENGTVIQELALQRRSTDDVCHVSLNQMFDTVLAHPYAEVVVLCGELAMPVATIRPRTLAQGVAVEDNHLVLHNPAPVPRLTATVYLTRAPWRRPVTLAVNDGRADLPTEYLDAGPLLVALSVPSNEWVTVEESRWPENYLMVGGEGHLTDGPADEVALSSYLAGRSPMPAEVSDPNWLWTVIDLATKLVPRARVNTLRGDCGRLLTDNPGRALTALASLGLDRDRTTIAMVASGLVTESTPQLDARISRRLWSTAPAAAVLVAGAMNEERLDAMLMVVGDNAGPIRETGVDPSAKVGAFDQNAVLLSTWTSAQIEAAWSAAQVVPKGLLDADTRIAAARKLFDAAVLDPGLPQRQLSSQAASHTKLAVRVVEMASPILAAQIQARMPHDQAQGWQYLPALSTAFAALARLAAHGDVNSRKAAERLWPCYVTLAETAPELVTIDLVIAEMLRAAE